MERGIKMTQAVAQTLDLTILPCPRCRGGRLIAQSNGEFVCDYHGHVVNVERFHPIAPAVQAAELALPEDATCIYHPQKKAVAVCEGTGNFICALCAAEVKGKTYSVQFLESKAGKKQMEENLSRYLPRPDRVIVNIGVAIFIPYVNALVVLPFPIWAAYGYYQCRQIAKFRRENALYGNVVGGGSVIFGAILISLLLALWIAGLLAVLLFGHFYRG